jgi:hypothetical protein
MYNFKRNIYRLSTSECDLAGTALEIALPVTGLNWITTVNNPCNATPWTISNGNLRIRYDISDSVACGGSCEFTQSGTATATITVGGTDVEMALDFEGIGEKVSPLFELIDFYLDGVKVANAHAPGGGTGCAMGPVVKEYNVPSPYFLAANTVHTLFIDFTTDDPLWHKDAFYEVNLSFTEIP